jgi:protein-disulfide isomerase
MARDIEMTMSAPVSKRDHSQGRAGAVITLVEYGDYQCPGCAQAYLMVKRAQQELGSQLRFVFRHFPLRDIHPHAQRAAEATEAASAQGKFWEMHDILFERQRALTDRHLRGYATDLGLDALRFDCELAARRHAKRIRDDVASGVKSGVNGTPTFFINGVRCDEVRDLSELMRTLQPLVAA